MSCKNVHIWVESAEKKVEIAAKAEEFAKAGKAEEARYENALISTIEIIRNFMERYADEADKQGQDHRNIKMQSGQGKYGKDQRNAENGNIPEIPEP